MKRSTFILEMLERRELLSATLYVSTSGNDSTGDGSAANPFATIQAAANMVQAGDTVDVESGTYAGFYFGWNGPTTGTAAAPIVFQADPNAAAGSVIIDSRNNKTPDGIDVESGCNYLTIQGFTITNDGSVTGAGIRVAGCSNFNILDNNVTGMGTWGIYTSFSVDALIEGNTCSDTIDQHGIYVANSPVGVQILDNTSFDNNDCGIQINGDVSQGGVGIGTDCLVEGNILYGNGAGGGAALNFDGLQDSFIENNLLYGNLSAGMAFFQEDASAPSIGNLVANNTVVMAPGADTAFKVVDGSTGNIVFNNIFLGGVTFDSQSETGMQMDYSVLSEDAGLLNAHSIISTAADLFTNAATNDYSLSATSPAIGLGVASFGGESAPSVDIDGKSRGSGNDDGAFQLGSTAPVQSQPTSGPSLVTFAQVPAATTAGAVLSPVVINVENSLRQIVTTDNSNVTLSIGSGPAGATLGGTLTVTAVNGVATFSDLSLSLPGLYTLVVSDGSLSGSISRVFQIGAAPVIPQLQWAQPPTDVAAGVKMSSPITIDLEDQNGNMLVNNHSFMKLTMIGGPDGGRIYRRWARVVNGVATFTNTWFAMAGTYTLVATDGAYQTADSYSFNVVPAAATRMIFSQQPIDTTEGTDFGINVALLDRFGNLVTTDSSDVTLSLGLHSADAVLSGTLTGSVNGGVASFSNLSVEGMGIDDLMAVSSEGLHAILSKAFRVS